MTTISTQPPLESPETIEIGHHTVSLDIEKPCPTTTHHSDGQVVREGDVSISPDVEVSPQIRRFFAFVAKFTLVLTFTSLVAAVFVLVNIQQYYKVAYNEVGNTLIDSVTAQVRSDLSKFFVPKFTIRSVFLFAISNRQINTQDTWSVDPGQVLPRATGQYVDIMAPIFYSDGDFLAAYQAFDNRQVLKYAGEIPDQWFIEHRHFVNESYQERLRCFVLKEAWLNMRDCTMLEPNVKSYDPWATSWYTAANETDGQCQNNCPDAFAWEGPDFQTALAEGDIDKPVFNMLFRLNWPMGEVPGALGTEHWSNFKIKFSIDRLKEVVDAVEVGKNGDIAIVNEKGEILAAQSLLVQEIQAINEDGEKFFLKIWSLSMFSDVKEEHLGQSETVRILDEGEYVVIANPIAEVPGWTIVVSLAVEDFLPLSSQKVKMAGALSILSIVLTAVRTILLVTTWGGQWYFNHGH